MGSSFKISGKELLDKIEELIREGNIRRIVVKDSDGKTYIEIPLTIGIIGALAAPVIAALGAIAGVIAKFSVEIIRKENGDVVEVKEVDEEK
jgi:hypothetical protein